MFVRPDELMSAGWLLTVNGNDEGLDCHERTCPRGDETHSPAVCRLGPPARGIESNHSSTLDGNLCKGLYRILAALPGSRSTDTAEKQTIHPGCPTRPGHGLRSDDGIATNATWNSRE